MVAVSLSELNGSNPMILKVRFQTSSASNFVRGVEHFRRDDLPGRAGMVSSLCAKMRRIALSGLSIGYRVGLWVGKWRGISRGCRGGLGQWEK
jgi:hypothetical protein